MNVYLIFNVVFLLMTFPITKHIYLVFSKESISKIQIQRKKCFKTKEKGIWGSTAKLNNDKGNVQRWRDGGVLGDFWSHELSFSEILAATLSLLAVNMLFNHLKHLMNKPAPASAFLKLLDCLYRDEHSHDADEAHST